MKTYQNILAAAALMLGLAGCSEDALVQQDAKQQQPLVEVTLGANFAATRTTMNGDGQVLWSEGDQIKVQVGTNAYDFTVVSGAGTQSATFKGSVTFEDAAILRGETQGTTVTACYPTSGAAVPASQEFAAGTFADGAFPMTATFENLNLTFSANAAVVRVQGVSATATNAVLSYAIGETPYSVTMALNAGDTAKDLYFVVVPGAKDFDLALDGGAAVKYAASEVTAAGSRYNLNKNFVAKIGDTKYPTLSEALTAAKDGDAVYIIPNELQETVSATNDNDIQLILDGKVLTGNITFGGKGTLIVRAKELNVNYYHSSNYSSEEYPTIPAKGVGGIMGKITATGNATVMLRENLYSGPFEGNVELRGGFYDANLGLQTIKDQTPNRIGLVVEQSQNVMGYDLFYVPEVPESYLVHVPAEFLAAALAGQLTYEQITAATLGYGLGDRILKPVWMYYDGGDSKLVPEDGYYFPDDVYAFFTNLKDDDYENPKYEYQSWYCDFEVAYSEPIHTDYQSGIWGYYSNMCFGCWLPTSATEQPFGMMTSTFGRWQYSSMLNSVGMFLCGPKNLNSEDAGKVITVNLKIYPDKESSDYITTNRVVYTIPTIQ